MHIHVMHYATSTRMLFVVVAVLHLATLAAMAVDSCSITDLGQNSLNRACTNTADCAQYGTACWTCGQHKCKVKNGQIGLSCTDGITQTTGDKCVAVSDYAVCKGTWTGCQNSTQMIVAQNKSIGCATAYCNTFYGCCCSLTLNTGQACNDGNPLTSDQCYNGRCRGVSCSCPTLPPSLQCVSVACNSSTQCAITRAAMGTSCTDGDSRTTPDLCTSAGMCSGCPSVTGMQCATATRNATTGICVVARAAMGTACNDGDSTTTGDQCTSTGDCSGCPTVTAAECASAVRNATTNICRLVHAAAGTTCDDGDSRTTEDQCTTTGACSGCPAVPTGAQCVAAVRNATTHACKLALVAAGTSCNDGDASTINDACNAVGVCRGKLQNCCSGTVCDPQCSNSTCDATTEKCIVTSFTGRACNDGDPYTTGDTCTALGKCVGTLAPNCGCPSSVPAAQCYTLGCGALLTCVRLNRVAGTHCDDGSPLTEGDICDGAGTCVGTPVENCGCPVLPLGFDCWSVGCNTNHTACVVHLTTTGTACQDDSMLTTGDICNPLGLCEGTPLPNCACPALPPRTQCFTLGCSEQTGLCTVKLNGTGTPCNDNDPLTTNDVCSALGVCAGTLVSGCGCPVLPSSSIECGHLGCAQGGVEACIFTADPVGTLCDDHNAQTTGDSCTALGACVGTPIDHCTCPTLPNNTQCFSLSCNNVTHACTVVYRARGSPCDDNDPVTQNDTCSSTGVCNGHLIQNCACPSLPTGTQCMHLGCASGSQTCAVVFSADGTSCNDSNSGTTNDTCHAGICKGVRYQDCACPLLPADVRQCMWLDWGGTTGLCTLYYRPDGTACNDSNAGTINDVCRAGVCAGAIKPKACPSLPADVQCKRQGWDPITELCTLYLYTAGTLCDDNDPLTTGDACTAGGDCVGQPVSDCGCPTMPAPLQCMHLGCVAPGEVCSLILHAQGSSCTDGNPLTYGDACTSGGLCVGTPLGECGCPALPNNTQCYSLHCGAVSGICEILYHARGSPCDDNDPVTRNDTCSSTGVCNGHLIQNCACPSLPAGTQCVRLGCAEGSETCSLISYADGTPCNDSNTGTKNDTCHAGICRGVRFQDCACPQLPPDVQQCMWLDWSTQTGLCSLFFEDEDTACDDGNADTIHDACSSGVCAGVVKAKACPSLPSDAQCKRQDWDPITELCTLYDLAIGTPCDDNDPLTRNDTCRAAGACIGTALANCGCPVLPCQMQCGSLSCVEGSEICALTLYEEGTPCSDNNPLTYNDACMATGHCVGNPLQGCTCPALPTTAQCLFLRCDNASECAVALKQEGAPCTDGDPLTEDDACSATGICNGDGISNCACPELSENTQCMRIGCLPDGHTCATIFYAEGTLCDDGDANTANDSCHSGICRGQIIDKCACPLLPPEVQCMWLQRSPETKLCTFFRASDGAACDDNDPLTTNDMCISAVCTGTAVPDCGCPSLPSPMKCGHLGCTEGSEICNLISDAAGTHCDDGDPLTTGDACTAGGICVGTPLAECGCPTLPNDTQCFSLHCGSGSGICEVLFHAQGSPCDDNDPITQNDVCSANGVCNGHLITNCACPALPSTTQCLHLGCETGGETCALTFNADGSHCNDSNPHTMNDTCHAGICRGVAVESYVCPQLPAEVQCMWLQRNPLSDLCKLYFETPGTACDDNDPLTLNDTCKQGGSCSGVPAHNCGCPVLPAGTQCMRLGCTEGSEICALIFEDEGTACTDGNPLTRDDVCTASGTCVGTPLTECGCPSLPPGAQCYDLRCGEVSNICEVRLHAQGTHCDDNDPVTQNDTCSSSGVCNGHLVANCACPPLPPETQCMHLGCIEDSEICSLLFARDGTACDDGSPHTLNDTCYAGACSGAPAGAYVCPQLPAEVTCMQLALDPVSSFCKLTFAHAGTPCDDSNPYTHADSCDGTGSCAGLPVPSCSACPTLPVMPQCASMHYNATSGTCVVRISPEGTPCDDNDPLTANDACSATGVCNGNALPNCGCPTLPQGTQCMSLGCNPQMDICALSLHVAGTPCDDGNPLTSDDACAGGICAGTLLPDCGCPVLPVGVQCMAFDCHGEGDACALRMLPNGTACDDRNAMTTNDACCAGVCTGTVVPNCGCPQLPEEVQCAYFVCGLDGLCTLRHRPAGTHCDDNDPVTVNDACSATGICNGDLVQGCNCPGLPSAAQCLSIGCNATTERCVLQVAHAGTPCDDGYAFTANDTCTAAGVCVGARVIECRCHALPSSVQCVSVECNRTSGDCYVKLADYGDECDDGNSMTEDDTCDGAGVCNGDVFETCGCPPMPTGVSCMYIDCDLDTERCMLRFRGDGTPCDDGYAFTTNDTCKTGICSGRLVTSCGCPALPQGVQCLTLGCDPTNGTCAASLPPTGTPCDDGNARTMDDACTAYGTCAGRWIECFVSSECTERYGGDNTCVVPTCALGYCVVNSATAGTACTVSGTVSGICDGAGECLDVRNCSVWHGSNNTANCSAASWPCIADVDCAALETALPAGPCRAWTCDGDTQSCSSVLAVEGTDCEGLIADGCDPEDAGHEAHGICTMFGECLLASEQLASEACGGSEFACAPVGDGTFECIAADFGCTVDGDCQALLAGANASLCIAARCLTESRICETYWLADGTECLPTDAEAAPVPCTADRFGACTSGVCVLAPPTPGLHCTDDPHCRFLQGPRNGAARLGDPIPTCQVSLPHCADSANAVCNSRGCCAWNISDDCKSSNLCIVDDCNVTDGECLHTTVCRGLAVVSIVAVSLAGVAVAVLLGVLAICGFRQRGKRRRSRPRRGQDTIAAVVSPSPVDTSKLKRT